MTCKPKHKSALRMATGGELHAANGFFGNLRKAILPTDAEKAAKAQYLAETAPAAPAAPASAPAQGISGYVGNSALDKRMKAAGLRHGGGEALSNTYQDGMGGQVPGDPADGDVFNAKYTAKEFVASNDMLKKAPGLRQYLRDLRAETLADKGMTVAQADAQALGYGDQGEKNGRTQGLQDDGQQGRSEALDQRPHDGLRNASRVPDTAVFRDSRPTLRAINGFPDDWQFSKRDGLKPGATDFTRAEEAAKAAARSGGAPPSAAPSGGGYAQHFAPEAPTKVTPESVGRAVGKSTKAFFNWLDVRGASKLLGAVGAIDQGLNAVTDAQQGNYAGLLDHGLRSAASAGSTSGNPFVAAPSMAYLGGTAVGDDLRGRMDPIQQGGVGHAVDKIVSGVGKLFGQDWGVDTTARDRLAGVDITAPVSAGHGSMAAAPTEAVKPVDPSAQINSRAAAYALRQGPNGPDVNPYHGDLTDKINAAMTSGRTDLRDTGMRANDIYKTVGKDGRVSYSGYGDGSGQMGSIVNGQGLRQASQGSFSVVPGMDRETVASTLRNPDGSQWTARDNATMASNLRDGRDPYAGTGAVDNLMPGARMKNETLRRGQDLEYGAKMATNKYNFAKDQRDFMAQRGDKDLENRRAEGKAWDDHANNVFQTVDPDTKKSIPDTKRIGEFTAATDATIRGMVEELQKSADPKKREYGALLAKNGRAALDEADRANMVKRFQLMEAHRGSYGMLPTDSSGAVTNDLRKYANMRPQSGNVLQERMEFLDENGQPTGASIPNVNLEYGPNASHFGPNFKQVNNSLR